MTAQCSERMILDGRLAALTCVPLTPLIEQHQLPIYNPNTLSTCHWRGYTGTWEIIDGRLHLVHINVGAGSWEAPMPPDMLETLLAVLPGNRLPAPATWFSGTLHIPMGRRLLYAHMGFDSVYSKERRIAIEAGRVASDEIVDTGAELRAAIAAEEALRAKLDVAEPGDGPAEIPVAPLYWLTKDDGTSDDEPNDLGLEWPADYECPKAA